VTHGNKKPTANCTKGVQEGIPRLKACFKSLLKKKHTYLRYMNDVMIKKTKELLTIYYNLLKISKNPIVAIIIIIPFIFGGTGVGI